MMNRKVLFWPLAAMLLTACEKGLVDGVADVAPTGQVMNSVLQVRTRSGGSAGGEATVAYPIAVYVFAGEECKAVLKPLYTYGEVCAIKHNSNSV